MNETRRTPRIHLEVDGKPRCRHREPNGLTADPGRVTCGRCLSIINDARTWAMNELDLKPHGTTARYRWHRRHGVPVCESCRQADARDQADRRARRVA